MLTLAVMVGIATILAGLLSLITTSYRSTASLEKARNRQYAADAAVEQAIQTLRTDPSVGAQNRGLVGANCGPSRPFFTPTPAVINNVTIRVDCQGQPQLVQDTSGTFVLQRNVVFAACEDTGVACTDATTLLTAKVNFATNAAGAVTGVFVQSWSVTR